MKENERRFTFLTGYPDSGINDCKKTLNKKAFYKRIVAYKPFWGHKNFLRLLFFSPVPAQRHRHR